MGERVPFFGRLMSRRAFWSFMPAAAMVIGAACSSRSQNEIQESLEQSTIVPLNNYDYCRLVLVDGVDGDEKSPVWLIRLEKDMFDKINTLRATLSIPALIIDEDLTSIARKKSIDMANRGYFAHLTPEGISIFSQLHAASYPALREGENIVRDNSLIISETVDINFIELIKSPTHYEMMMDGYFNRIGVGYSEARDGWHYFTMLFAQYSGS